MLKRKEEKCLCKGTLGVEPRTSRSAVECSTTELYPHCVKKETEFFSFKTTITWHNTRRHILSPWIRYLYWGLEYKIFEFDYDIKWISLNVNYASNSPAGNLCFSGRLQAFRNRSREMRNKT